MTGLIQVLGVIFGIVLILVGILESFFFRDQRLHRLFLIKPEDMDACGCGRSTWGSTT